MISKNVIEQNITKTLETNYMPYAMSVIISRAIPEIDGFKPSHRKLLYTMYKMGLLKGNRIKSADVVGQTMRLNPHGDTAIYETLVRLTRGNDSLLHPFIDSKGNFGKIYSRDMAYAASRYTEVKLAPICQELFKDIDKNTVDFIDNYNSSMKEPTLFPTTYPNVLVTPNQGIAVGMASSISSFNLKEVCKATIEYLKNPNCNIYKYLLAPDFSTGGEIIFNENDIKKVYETGKGSIKIRAKYKFDKKNNCIEIYEIPYTTSIESIIDKIISLVKTNKLKEISDIRDETDLNGLKIAIDIKKSVNPEFLMHKLFSMTPLEDSFSCNFNLLIEGKPKTLGIKSILDEWSNFRIKCIKRQIIFDIEKKSEKLHLLNGLKKIILNIDKAIDIIRKTEEDSMVISNLINFFSIDKLQAEYVCEIKLRNLNKEYLLNKITETDNLAKNLEELKSILDNEDSIKNIIISELKEISKKYGTPRRSEIVYNEDNIKFSPENFIQDYTLKVFLTKQGYFKKIPLISLRSSINQNLKENDEIMQEIETYNKSEILFFSNKCNVYKTKLYDLHECKASSLGEYLPNILQLDEDENIIYISITKDYDGFMLFGFSNGKIAKVPMSVYNANRKKLINAYSDKSNLTFICQIKEDKDLLAICNNKIALFSTNLLKSKLTKSSIGSQIINLKKNNFSTKFIEKEDFVSNNVELYRIYQIPDEGHIIFEDDLVNIKDEL